MKNILFSSLVLIGMSGSAYAQYYNGPQPWTPSFPGPSFPGCVTGREGTCPTNKLPRKSPSPIVCIGMHTDIDGSTTCSVIQNVGPKPRPTPVPIQGTSYSVF